MMMLRTMLAALSIALVLAGCAAMLITASWWCLVPIIVGIGGYHAAALEPPGR